MPVFLLTLLAVLLVWLAYENAPGRVYRLAMAGERALARLHDRRVEAAGHRIALLDGGRGEPILLLHGFGADRYHWPRLARYLTPRYRVLAPDLPGFGESSCIADADYDIAAQVERLRALLQVLGTGPVHLAGNSMGGHLATAYLRAYPDDVRSLFLLDAAGVDPQAATPFNDALRDGQNLLLADSRRDFRRLTALMFNRQPFIPGRVLDFLGDRSAARRDWNHRVFEQYMARSFADLQAGPPPPVVPTLILWGRDDRVLPVEDLTILAGLMPHAQTVVLDDTGHLPMLERPRTVAAHYLRLLERARGSAGVDAAQASSCAST